MIERKRSTYKIGRKVISAVLAACLGTSLVTGCSSSQERQKADFSGVNSVCELATLRCYYHNVAKAENEASGLLAGLLKTGYKKLWIEYSGVVEVGIDVSQVEVGEPDENGVVQVHIPDAEVLTITLDENSIADPVIDKGLFTDITTEEITNAVAIAQEDMEKTAYENTAILAQAKNRAKLVLEEYIRGVGETIGETYTVEWV